MADVNLKFILDSISSQSSTEDDRLFRKKTKEQIKLRDKGYTNLLTHFICVTRFRNWIKEFFKWSFMAAIILCTFLLARYMYLLTEKYIATANVSEIIASIPLLITSVVSIVSAVISIPVIITKYLFSTEEDKYITNIILHTQEHDTSGRDWATKHERFNSNKEPISGNKNDQPA